MRHTFSRRTLLRGLGVGLALPWLEVMGPLSSWAGASQADAGSRVAPNRLAFLYVPNGVIIDDWTPATEGADYELPPTLEPLSQHRRDLCVLTGLTSDKARHYGDSGGGHARALAAYLTGVHPRKTNGTNILCGVSVDQVAAGRVGDRTRLPSLEIGCEAGRSAGACDSGYSCVYQSTLAWRSATTPLPKEINPRFVFQRLFQAGATAGEASARLRDSVLDAVLEDAHDLRRRLGSNDQRKLDEYLESLRDVEQRIRRVESLPEIQAPDYPLPAGIPADREAYIRLMCDLLVLAFQTDATRICTFLLGTEGSNLPYAFLGVPEGHHDLSHHGNNPEKMRKIATINRFHTAQFDYLLGKLKSVQEGDGTLLDHCLLVYGSGMCDGNGHAPENLPILLAGRGGGSINSGRHIRYPAETPLNNLWMALLDRIDVRVPFVGDANGRLPNLS